MGETTTIRSIENAMTRIARSMGRRDLGRQVERTLGSRMDPSLLLVINAIDDLTEPDEAPTIKDIARHLDVHHSRASRLVKDTIRNGLVARLASQEDARKSPLALSDRGRAIATAIHAARAKFFAARLHGWSKAESRNFARLLERFAEKDAETSRKNDRHGVTAASAAIAAGARNARTGKRHKRRTTRSLSH